MKPAKAKLCRRCDRPMKLDEKALCSRCTEVLTVKTFKTFVQKGPTR
jgi:uncharacterized paraquat-inducible protein A